MHSERSEVEVASPRDGADEIAEVIAVAREAGPRLGAVTLVAIDGPSGSGKSTFARALVAGLRDDGVGTVAIGTDHFATWDRPTAWWPRLSAVLDRLAEGEPARYGRTVWPNGVPVPGPVVEVPVPEVLVVEGVSAGRASVRSRVSCLCWVECADPATRLARAVARDGEGSRSELAAWQRFERGWFAVDGTRARADVVLFR